MVRLESTDGQFFNTSVDGERLVGQEQKLPLEELQYLAGAFDAGCYVAILPFPILSARLTMQRKDHRKLECFHSFFPKEPYQNKKGLWVLDMAGLDTLALLEVISPHLRLLKPMVDLVIDFQKEKDLIEQFNIYEKIMRLEKEGADFRTNEPFPLFYMAGLFDNRGSISYKRTGRVTHDVVCQIGVENESFTSSLKEQFGGSFNQASQGSYFWRTVGKNAKSFLRSIRPFMRVRGNEVDETLAKAV